MDAQNYSIRDRADGKGGMPLIALERMLGDIRNQPMWRPTADKCAAYYDGKQMTEALRKRDEAGQKAIITNLVARAINAALGQEAKTRLDWKPAADSDVFADVAEVYGQAIKEAQRETRADMAMSDGYASGVKTGIGFVKVRRNPDPLGYPYIVEFLHRNQVWWDWRAKGRDIHSGKFVLEKGWVDMDELAELVPESRPILGQITAASGSPINDAMMEQIMVTNDFDDVVTMKQSFDRLQEEWLDNSYRKRAMTVEVHYKVPTQVVALVSGTKRVKFNPRNPVHAAAVQRGLAKLVKGPSYTIRRAMFVGPFRIFDEPLPCRKFPIQAFWAYQDDNDGSPYGLVHGMVSPQDEYNERRSRLNWLLKAKQILVDNDALDESYNTFEELAAKIMRPDAVIVLDAARKGQTGLKLEEGGQLSAEQVNVMMDAKQLIQEVPGLYNAFMGKGNDGASSGIALNSLVEQSIVSLGEIADNFRTFRADVGEVLLDLIGEDHAAPNMRVMVGTGSKQREVVLNTFDEQGIPVNHVSEASVRMGLSDVPSSPSHKLQQGQQIGQALSSAGNNPIAQAVLLPAFIEMTDIPHREEYAKWMRQQSGIPEPGQRPDPVAEKQAMGQMQQKAAIADEVQTRMAGANVRKAEADAALAENKANQTGAMAEREYMTNAAAAMPQEPPPPTEDELAQQAAEEALAGL